jgi:23S rRNA (uracil1939-C5)-methyltransferase
MVEIEITGYSKKGHGVGESSSGTVEVPGAAIGDRVEVALGKRRGGIYKGSLLRILCPSPYRTDVTCGHAALCGGCSWQHLCYSAQIELKGKKVATLFASLIGKGNFFPILPCLPPWHYRSKMEFTFSQNKAGKKFLGLIMKRSRGKVENLEECSIAPPWMAFLLATVREWWEKSSLQAYHPHTNSGSLQTLTLRQGKGTGEKMVILTVSGNHDDFLKKNHLASFKETVLESLGEDVSLFLQIHRASKGKPSASYEMHLHGPDVLREILSIRGHTFTFTVSPSSFFQPNLHQVEKLYTRALEIAQPTSEMSVYDLYAGTGTLGMIFAPFVRKVVCVESNPYAICDAKTNVETNHLSNLRIIEGDVSEVLSALCHRIDLIILDPPRAGLDKKTLKHLIRLRPKKILYISCNPITQRSDIFTLAEAGFHLKTLQPVDQFPHTPHIENIAFLETPNCV